MAVLNFTAREFRSRLAHVFDLADQGEKIIIRRRKQAYTLVPIEDEDLTITPELQAKIDKVRVDIKAGRVHSMLPGEDLDHFLDRVEPYIGDL